VVDAFNPPGLWQPFGPFSQIAVQGDGRILHLKGQVALDRDGHIVGAGDMRAQLHQVLENIRAALASVGGEMGDILSMTNYVTDMDAFLAAADIRRAFLTAPYPETTTVEVTRLYDRALLVEISAIAEIPPGRFKRP
jgi:enamine deaminase RidA (YjgF/YER057c/UK114 family)